MKWAIFAACVKLCKIVTTIFWRVDEKLINLQAKLSLVPHVSALVNKRELFMMKTEQRQTVWIEFYLAGACGMAQIRCRRNTQEYQHMHFVI